MYTEYTGYVSEYWDMMQNAFITVDCSIQCWNPLNVQRACMLLLTCQTPCPPSLPHSFIHSFIPLKNIRCLLGAKHPTQSYRGTKKYQKP